MSEPEAEAVRRVLTEAAAHPTFFDLSDAERLNRLIARGFALGRSATANDKRGGDGRGSNAAGGRSPTAASPARRGPAPCRPLPSRRDL